MMCRHVCIAACLMLISAVAVADVAHIGANMALIDDVPSYKWYQGCGPTVAGMIIGYWDAHGFDDLIDGSNDWSDNNTAVKAMIASEGHIRDYAPDVDRTPTADDPLHPSDSVADFMYASRYPLEWGTSFAGWQYLGMAGYANYKGYAYVGNSVQYSNLWDTLVDEIDASRPMELYVDRTGDGNPDHFVAAIGYDDGPDGKRYAAYNSYDHDVHWYDFTPPAPGQEWGVRSGTWFAVLQPEPVTGIVGDFDGSGRVDAEDIDLLYEKIYRWVLFDPMYDLNGDGLVTDADMDVMISDLVQLADGTVGTVYGDANLDGLVDLDDFFALKMNYLGEFTGWAEGNYDGDGDVDMDDFVVLRQSFGYVSQVQGDGGAAVPEPATAMLMATGAAMVLRRRRTRI